MPADPSIYNALAAHPKSMMDYENDYARHDLQQQAIQQNALALQTGQQKNDEYKRNLADQAVVRNALAGVKDQSFQGRYNALMQTGTQYGMQQADALQKAELERQKTQAGFEKDGAETQAKRAETHRKMLTFGIQSLQAAQTPQQAAARINQGVQLGYWSMRQAQQMLSDMPQDPAAYQPWRQEQLRTVIDAEKQLPRLGQTNLGGTEQYFAQDPITGAITVNATAQRTQSPDSVASNATTVRGQDLTDKRARELAESAREATVDRKSTAAEDKRVANVEKEVTKFASTLQKEGIPEIENALGGAEGVMKRYQKVGADGKVVQGDVPGVGAVKNALPAALMSDEGKDARQALAQVRNIVLSARSGAAVTDQELRRLVEEIGTGGGMSASDIWKGLTKIRARLEAIKENAAAGVSDDVLNTYIDRGGIPVRRGKKPAKPAPGPGPAHPSDIQSLLDKY